MSRGLLWALTVCLALGIPGGSADALGPGDAAPPFELPRLEGAGALRAPDLFLQAPLTVLVFWNRGCPECTEVALGMQALADSLRPLGVEVVGVAFGPDDPVSIQDQLRRHRIAVLQLWDAAATVAARYEIGRRHLSVFLVDRGARVREAFDDQIPNLVDPVLPAARRALGLKTEDERAEQEAEPARAEPDDEPPPARPSARPAGEAPPLSSVPSALKLDARMKMLSTEGARSGDRGLYSEPLENGVLFLHRYEVRLPWTPAAGVEFVPWLRVSNEPDEILREGAEQLTSSIGSASLHLRRGRTAGTLGAFPLRVAPLLLQRWDASDAPPLGGVSGCACGAGATGFSQRSLEVLGPEYTFEGLSVSRTEEWATLRAWLAVPRWERFVRSGAPIQERETARYRRVLGGSLLDLGPSGTRDAESGLPVPLGLRFGVLSVADDGRSLGPGAYRPQQHDERGWVGEVRLEPVVGLSADAQWVGWKLDEGGRESEANGYLAGVRGSFSREPFSFWGRLHRLRTEPDFAPLYRALTYEPNQDGWRIAGGVAAWPLASARRERLSASVFYRTVRETKEREAPGLGKARSDVLSVTLAVRPVDDLLAELSAVETRVRRPVVPIERGRGLSLDLRWEGWAFLDPILRVDAIRREAWDEARTIWQAYLWVRVVR